MAKNKKSKGRALNCKPSFRVSEAGHLLAVKGSSRAGKILSSEGKAEKRKRLQRGCLNGPPGTFKLTEKQKRNLPLHLQKAILEHHKRKGDKLL